MSGIKCLGNIMRSTSRISSQVCPGVCRNMAKDITHSKRKLCTIASLTWNADVLSTKFVNKSVTKFPCSSPVTLGCVSMITPLLAEISDSGSSDMLECVGSDDDSETWSLS